MTVRDETTGPPTNSSCPSWETLSCYSDAELAADEVATVEHHLAQCGACRALVQMLPVPIAVRRLHSDGGPDCLGMEMLLDYLASPQAPASGDTIDAHIRQCDVCVGRLAVLQRQAHLDHLAAVPAAVVARAAAAVQPDRQHLTTLRDAAHRAPSWLRLPVLMPLAFAAGVFVFMGTQQLWQSLAGPGERWRAVQARPPARPSARRVLTTDTLLRMAGQSDAGVVTALQRGTTVDIITEQSEWLQVALADGRRGWVSRGAFE